MSERDDDVGLDPFGVALAEHVGSGNPNPDVEDILDGELNGLLFDDDEDGADDVLAFAKALEATHSNYFGPRPDTSVDPEYDAEAQRLREQYAADAETGLDPFSDPLKS